MSPASQQPLLLGLEAAQDLQRRAFDKALVAGAPDAPTPLPFDLEQEHVVRIEVRADAAAIGGERQHQVIDTGIGHEAKRRQPRVCRVHVQVDALHQQGPAGPRQRRQRAPGQRAVAQLPARGSVLHQA